MSKQRELAKNKNRVVKKRGTVNKNYHVSSQTAYHIQQLAFENNMTEGHVIDKLVRNYLCNFRQ